MILIVSNVIAENVQAIDLIMLTTMQALDSFVRAFLPLPSTLQLALAACQKNMELMHLCISLAQDFRREFQTIISIFSRWVTSLVHVHSSIQSMCYDHDWL
jgi:hypothetical protein